MSRFPECQAVKYRKIFSTPDRCHIFLFKRVDQPPLISHRCEYLHHITDDPEILLSALIQDILLHVPHFILERRVRTAGLNDFLPSVFCISNHRSLRSWIVRDLNEPFLSRHNAAFRLLCPPVLLRKSGYLHHIPCSSRSSPAPS